MRLFAALPVPPNIGAALTRFQKDLSGASWRPAENFHITLCFFGEVTDHLARDLDDLIGAAETPAFDVRVEGAGWFGRREPAAVWMRVRESDELRALAGRCESAARRLGLNLERRPFTPHITLAYCHGTPLADAMRWSERHQTYRSPVWQAGIFHLYSSRPRASGPNRYVPEADYPLTHVNGPEGTY